MGPEYFEPGRALGSLLILIFILWIIFSTGRWILCKLHIIKTPPPKPATPGARWKGIVVAFVFVVIYGIHSLFGFQFLLDREC
jgi:hypothetical protein